MKLHTLSMALLAACSSTAYAEDLFQVNASGGGASVTASGQSLPSLVENLIKAEGDFAGFNGNAFNASLNYANLQDAIVLDANASGTTVRLRVPSTGLDRTFTGSNRNETEDAVVDFLTQDGASELAAFLAQVNEQTVVGVADGNPTALTAQLSGNAFGKFGQRRFPFRSHEAGGTMEQYEGGGFRAEGFAGSIEAGDFSGTIYGGSLTRGFSFSDRVGLIFSTPAGYRTIEGSNTYYLGTEIALPILFVRARPDQPLSWQLTPFAQAGAAGSADQISGGVVLGGGGASLLGLRLGDFTLTLGNQLSAYGGTPITFGDYEFETDVDQLVFKNGVGVAYGVRQAYIEGTLTHTQLLNDAAIDYWISPGVNLGLKLGSKGLFRIGYEADLGDDYTVHKGQVQLGVVF